MNVGCTSSVTLVTTPRAPRLTTLPRNVLAVLLARQVEHSAVSGDDLQRGDGGREIAVVHARAMGRGGARSCDRDVRQRREVVQRHPVLVEIRAQLAVAHAGLDGHCARRGVQCDDLVHLPEREEIDGAVGNPVEAVARAEHLQLRVLPDEILRPAAATWPGRGDRCCSGSCRPN